MIKYLITCEHGGHQIPAPYEKLFSSHQILIKSHRGWDEGSLKCAKIMAEKLNKPLFHTNISRLLIEFNRTLGHPELFSDISNNLPDTEKEHLINEFYLPYRNKLRNFIQENASAGHQVVHLSIHSFTPVLNDGKRLADIGILFDPDKVQEEVFATEWRKSIASKNSNWTIKFNYPYLGTDDGLTTFFRQEFPRNYVGLELEINQKLFKVFSARQIAGTCIPDFIK